MKIIVFSIALLVFAGLSQAVMYEDFESYTDTADMTNNGSAPIYCAGSSTGVIRSYGLDATGGSDGGQCLVTNQRYTSRTSNGYWMTGWKFDYDRDGTVDGINLSGYSAIRLWYKGEATNPDPGAGTTRIEVKDPTASITIATWYLDGAMTNPNWTMVEIPINDPASWASVGYIYFRAYQGVGQYLDSTIRLDNLEFVPEPATIGFLGFGALALLRRKK